MQPSPSDSFENLEVWRRAHALSIDVYRLLSECRSDNIAEGAERLGRAEFRQFLSVAKGSAGETRSQVLRAQALGYLDAQASGALLDELRQISRMIHGLIRSLQ